MGNKFSTSINDKARSLTSTPIRPRRQRHKSLERIEKLLKVTRAKLYILETTIQAPAQSSYSNKVSSNLIIEVVNLIHFVKKAKNIDDGQLHQVNVLESRLRKLLYKALQTRRVIATGSGSSSNNTFSSSNDSGSLYKTHRSVEHYTIDDGYIFPSCRLNSTMQL